jgi:hypothetical protein
MKNDLTLEKLEQLLNNSTASEPENSAFLEGNRVREQAYCQRSARRWLDIIRLINNTGATGKCLDIGTSPLTFVLKNWCSTVDTLDYSDYFTDRCHKAGIKLYVPGSEWLANLPDNHYNCVIFLEVIEHMHMNPEYLLAEIRKKLRPGGLLILSTPNMMCFGNRLRMLANRKLMHFTYPPFNSAGLHGHAHDRIYSPAEMKQYFQNTQWSSFEICYHSLAVADSISHYDALWKRIVSLPVLLIKYLVPSTRQHLLALARK